MLSSPPQDLDIQWTKLPFRFDAAALGSEVNAIPASEWVPHFNQHDYDGAWSSVALRSRSGRADDIVPQGDASEYAATPLLDASLALRAVLDTFQMPLKSARLLRLHAGSRVREHRDHDLTLADGEVRIHVPVVTSDAVEFIVANRRLRLREGESWFIDFSQPHRIFNGGAADRVHLVIDGTLNDWTREMLLRASNAIVTETEEPEGMAALRAFRDVVFDTPSLQRELMACEGRDALLDATVLTASERGFIFDRADANALLNANRQEWQMRAVSL